MCEYPTEFGPLEGPRCIQVTYEPSSTGTERIKGKIKLRKKKIIYIYSQKTLKFLLNEHINNNERGRGKERAGAQNWSTSTRKDQEKENRSKDENEKRKQELEEKQEKKSMEKKSQRETPNARKE